MYLVLQLDCTWNDSASDVDRILYAFCCNSRLCTEGSPEKAWRIFILQKENRRKLEPVTKTKKGLWDIIEGDFENKCTISEIACTENFIYAEAFPVAFPGTYLSIEDEIISENPQNMVKRTANSESSAVEDWSSEGYEKMMVSGFDRIFKRFSERVAHNPQQLVRFCGSGRGQPLPSSIDGLVEEHDNSYQITKPAICVNCKKPQNTFEAQLMPTILTVLPTNKPEYLCHLPPEKRASHPLFGDGMEWSTVLIFTCGLCRKEGQIMPLIDCSVVIQLEK